MRDLNLFNYVDINFSKSETKMTRIYTFDEGSGLRSARADPATVKIEDELLQPIGLANSQLGILYVVDSQGKATPDDLAFALVMDRKAVDRNIGTLRRLRALDLLQDLTVRVPALKLTAHGKSLLRTGIQLWRKARDFQLRLVVDQIATDKSPEYTTAKSNVDLIG